MAKGYLAFVLHAHLPFIRHPESEKYLEERWLFEAITETYIPILQVYQGLLRDGVDFRITMSVTPPLLSMLADSLLQQRYLKHIHSLVELAEKEVSRTAEQPEFHTLAKDYLARFTGIRDFYLHYNGNLVSALREVQDTGCLEIITSAATHAFLPLVYTEEALRAQIQTAVEYHAAQFGRRPRGIWLPECGYMPGLDRILAENGIEYFFTDTHGVSSAEPAPAFGTLSPVLTPNGVAAFPRDPESSKQVWSAQEGYPGDFCYREYYRDIGFDLDFDCVKDYIHPDGIRINTGIKYYRITGAGDYKEPYNVKWARDKAAEHAGNFLFNRQKQVEHWSWHMGRSPIVVAPYDSELFGHWWFEGPMFIDFLMRKIHFDQNELKTITPGEYLDLYMDYQVCRLPMSSWGREGYADVWLRGENDWLYPALHMAEGRMVELARRISDPKPVQHRALNQAAREMMLAQSSDWAFIMDSKTMVDYAVKRSKYHINRFTRLFEMLRSGNVDEKWLANLEAIDNIFPDIDYRVYRPRYALKRFEGRKGRPRLLVLAWEFPPVTIGGLSRHVYDLTRYLAGMGWEVHVVTMEAPGAAYEDVVDGVYVHRVHVMQPDGGEFVHWAFQLNLMMIDTCKNLIESGLTFDLVHAHDWLVCYTAKTLKQLYHLPLVATIHATEHGRNQGIYTDLQRYIHNLEWRLTYEAQRVIVCSSAMRREVETVFSLPSDKIAVIPNGVEPKMLQPSAACDITPEPYALQNERVVLFVGRLVREKGVHILLQAATDILGEFADVKFLVAGQGPAREDLENLAGQLGLGEKVLFTGFVTDEERNRLLRIASVAVFPSLYEPFGIVALEAMAAGTPMVVSDVGGLADVVEHNRNGLKAYPGDAHSIATQVKDLLRDSHRAKVLAEEAIAELNRFDWRQIAESTVGVYREIRGEQESESAAEQIAVGVIK